MITLFFQHKRCVAFIISITMHYSTLQARDDWESFKQGICFSLGGALVTAIVVGTKSGLDKIYAYYTKTPAQKQVDKKNKELEPFELEIQMQENINQVAARIRETVEAGWAHKGPGKCHLYPQEEQRACVAFEENSRRMLKELLAKQTTSPHR